MLNAGNVGGQEVVAAHEAARDRDRHVMERQLDRQDQRRAVAHRYSYSTCPLCETRVGFVDFLAHLEICPKAAEDPQKKLLAIHENNSNTHMLHRELQKLREACEVSFLEAKQNPGKLVDMACRLCKSNAEHLGGGCLGNRQKAVFEVQANKIASKVLIHFEQALNLKTKIAVDRLTREHEEYFDSIEGLLNSESAGMDAWEKIEETTNKQHREKVQLVNSSFEENQRKMEEFKAMVKRTVERFARQMDEYLAANERNVHELHLIIARGRRAQGVEEVEEQPAGIDQEGVAQLEAFFANRKAAKERGI